MIYSQKVIEIMYKIIYESYISEGCNNKKSLCYFLKHVKTIHFIYLTQTNSLLKIF